MTERDIGSLIKNIDEKLKAKADADLKAHNLTMVQSFVLTFLCEKGGQATQKEIEDFLGISHPAVVGIVSRMEQNHHLTSWIDPQNRRNKIVCLTAEARAMSDTMNLLRQQWETTLLDGLTGEEIASLKHMLQRILNNFKEN